MLKRKLEFEVLRLVYGTSMGLVMILILFFQSTSYLTKKHFLFSNLTIFVLLCLFIVIISLLRTRLSILSSIKEFFCANADKIVLISTPFLFFLQCFICHGIFFLSGWDVATIRDASSPIPPSDINTLTHLNGYFSCFPNNLLITYLAASIRMINASLGLFSGEYETMCLVVTNCFINSFTCFMVYKVCSKLCGKSFALYGYFLAVFLLGFSPWSVIFYSDSAALFIPITVFYLWTCTPASKALLHIHKLSAVFLSILGYNIKPQCLIILIAIVGVELLLSLRSFQWKKLLPTLPLVLAIGISCHICTQAVEHLEVKLNLDLNDSARFGICHYLMMGANVERNGIFAEEDVRLSLSIPDASDRRIENLRVAAARYKELGISGTVKHLAKKLLITFNDGTFAWNVEGGFYHSIPDSRHYVDTVLRSYYHEGGTAHDYFHLVAQILWLSALVLSFTSCFFSYAMHIEKHVGILWISVFGNILFYSLFEARARYLYVYAPFFCVLAVLGIKALYQQSQNYT